MKKSLKAVSIILLTILILVAVVAIVVDIFADYALKTSIEVAATKTLNVGVNVEGIDLAIMTGRVGISNLSINNPPGYQHDKLLELKNAQIKVDVGSLLSDRVDVREIRLDGVNVVLEQRGVTSNNLQDIIKTIAEKRKARDKSGKARKNLRIGNLEISNITVKAKLLPVPGRADTVTLKLNPIVMTDLGSDSKLDMAELSGRILLAIADSVADEGVDVLPKEMTGAMKSTLSRTIRLGRTATEEGKNILEEGKDSGKKLIEGVKGLLKKPEQQERSEADSD